MSITLHRRQPSHETPTSILDGLSLSVIGINVRIRCPEGSLRTLLTAHYGRMHDRLGVADLDYTVARRDGSWRFARNGREPVVASDPGELLLLLDQDLVIRLQELRRDLYFIHAGVLEFAGRAFMLVAESGGGKSTIAWALVHHGFGYLSDELGPVDLTRLAVHPYPRALLLKTKPPASYPLPRNTMSTSRGFHIRTEAIPGGIRAVEVPLSALFFLRYIPTALEPSARSISVAHASARLYANTLNALAHPGDGLDGAIQIARKTACFDLSAAHLTATCALVKATVATLPSR